MTVSSFSDARKENAEGGLIFGNTDHFGETVTYRPAAGGSPRSIDVTVFDAVAEEIDGEIVDYDQELIWVGCCKDTTCDRGGIDTPKAGDTILRSGDDASNPWAYMMQTRKGNNHSWQLLFGRKRLTGVGQTGRI